MKIVNGNLLDAKEKYIAHCVNTIGVMGSGVALVIKQKWPEVYEEYRKLCENEKDEGGPGAKDLLGSSQIVGISEDQSVVNMFGQYEPGTGKQARYIYITSSIESFVMQALQEVDVIDLAIPYKIASDRAGLNWEIVKEIFEEYEELLEGSLNITAYKL